MKRKNRLLLLLIPAVLLCVFLIHKMRTGPYGLPLPESFSDTQYESYALVFPPVVSATYSCGETTRIIEPDDPELVRLLNFLANSWDRDVTWYRHGYVDHEELSRIESMEVPMLEIVFQNEPYRDKGDGVANIPKILVIEDRFLLYPDSEGASVEEYYPYGALIAEELTRQNRGHDHAFFTILEYMGLTD